MQAMILAAGFGTRLRPYTLIKPKPLFPVLNKPLLYILLDMLQKIGCERIVVNCHHLGEQVKDALAVYPDVIVQNETEILGTGGSLRCALDNFDDEPVLVMNGDIYHTVDIKQLYTHHFENSVPVTMAMHDYDRFNTVAVENGRVRSFNHCIAGPKMAFTGIHVINPDIIEMIPKDKFFHIIDLYQQLAEEKKINLLNVSGAYWRDIGTVSDYLELHRELLAMRGSTSCFEIGENVKISSNAQLEKWCVIGCNSVVYDHCLLSGTVVWENSVVNRGAVVRDTIVTGTSSDGD